MRSHADAEKAPIAEERREIDEDFHSAQRERAVIYIGRGRDLALARRVAEMLMVHNALAAHARAKFGMSAAATARLVKTAVAFACSFSAEAVSRLIVAAMALKARLIG